MANRYAPYRERFLTREPRCLVVKFTANGTTGEQTLADSPFNEGIVNVVASATGIYKVALGTSSTMRDSYAHFAGMSLCTTEADKDIDEVTNSESNHATDPNITFVVHTPSSGDAAYVSNTETVWVRLYFLDSTD